MYSRERRYSRYKSADVWATLYEQQRSLDVEVQDGSVRGNTVALVRLSTHHAHRAVVLARSSDWYSYSLNCQSTWKHDIDLVVCGTHDSCLPVPCLALDQLKWFDPKQLRISSLAPERVDDEGYCNDPFDAFRKHQYGHNMLIGALMQGRQDAIQRLLHMRRSTRLRIESEIKRLRHRRQGRPLAV